MLSVRKRHSVFSRPANAKSLLPMTPFERKIVHDAVAKVAGVSSESEGR